MKIFKFLLLLTITILNAQMALAQEKRSYRDIAFDYILQNIESIRARPWSVKSDSYHKMPDGGYIVDMAIERTLTLQEEKWVPNQVHAYGATFNMGVKRGTTYTNYKDTKNYIVFVDSNGKPLAYFQSFYKYKFENLTNTVCFIINGSIMNVDGQKIQTEDKYIVYSLDGKKVWEMNDLMVFSKFKTSNNYYLAGEIITPNGARSIVRVLDLQTFQAKDIVGEMGDIAYNLRPSDKGVAVNMHKDKGGILSQIIPYASSDRTFQIQKILQMYDLSKPQDQVSLGERYLNGDVFDKDEKKAFDMFQKAANQGNGKGLYKVAYCYHRGIGVAQNIDEAILYYEKSAYLNNYDAMVSISNIYVGEKKDLPKALFWKEKLGLLDNIDAQKFVIENASIEYTHPLENSNDALLFARENIKNANYPWAKFCYERAISLGNKDAMFDYGKWLYEGNGITKDCNKAIEFLGQIGEEDNLDAQRLLIKIYKDNNGVSPNFEKEMYWVTKAANNNDEESVLRLAQGYKYGTDGLKKDKKLSSSMFVKAAELGNQDAIKELVYCYATGTGVKKDEEQCLMWYSKLKGQKQYEIAKETKNKKLSSAMFQRAAELGNLDAAKELVFRYTTGYGVKKDYALSLKWFQKLDANNQFQIANIFDGGEIKCGMELVICMFQELANKKIYNAMKRYAELCVRYLPHNKAVDALNLLERANVSYSTKNADVYMLWGELHEMEGNFGQAIECYRNSGTQQGRERASLLNRHH